MLAPFHVGSLIARGASRKSNGREQSRPQDVLGRVTRQRLSRGFLAESSIADRRGFRPKIVETTSIQGQLQLARQFAYRLFGSAHCDSAGRSGGPALSWRISIESTRCT
jgi:hypothetical protein